MMLVSIREIIDDFKQRFSLDHLLIFLHVLVLFATPKHLSYQSNRNRDWRDNSS